GMEGLGWWGGGGDGVTCGGLVRRGRVLEACATARVLALPSEVEGFGLTLLEAMQRGVAVVASTRGGSRELVTDGVSGVLVPPGDVDALAARLSALLTDDPPSARLAAGRAAAAAPFTTEPTVATPAAQYGA